MFKDDKIIEKAPTKTGITKIKNNITEIKKSRNELKTQIENFNKEKKTLAKELIKRRQNEIEDKRLEIEKKREETQELIKGTEELDELEYDINAKKELGDLKKEFLEIKPTKESFEPKDESFIGKIKEVWIKTREKIKEYKKPIIIGASVIWWLFLLKSLFRRKHKEKSEKKEKKSIWKKLLIWLWVATWWILVWKNWDKIKDWFVNLFGWEKPKENTPHGDFENLSEEMKNKYRNLSTDIDSSSKWDIPILDSESDEKDKDEKSEIIFRLDKKIGNLSNFNTTETLDYIQWETSDGIFDKVKNWWKWVLYDALWWYLWSLSSFQPFGAKFVSAPAQAVAERLKEGKPEERKKLLSSFYKEYMNILDYVTDKKKLILYKKAQESIMGLPNINQEPDKDQKKLIDELYENKDWCNKQLKDITLSDIPWLMIKYKIDKTDISQETRKTKEKLDEKKEEILQTDDSWFSIIDRAEDDFDDWKLEKDTRDDLIEMFEDWWDDLFGNANEMWFFGAYTHLLTDMFGWNKELADNYMKQMWYDELINEIKTIIKWNISKLKSDSFTKDDLSSIKSRLDEYFIAKEKFTNHLNDIKDSNDSWFEWSKLFNSLFVDSFKDVWKLFGLGKTNSRWERIGRWLWGATVSGWVLYITWSLIGLARPWIWSLVRIGGKTAFKIWTLPIELFKMWITKSLGRTYLTWLGWSEAILNSNFSKQEIERLTSYAFLKGEVSQEKALILLEKWTKTTYDINGLLDLCWMKDAKSKELFKKYSGNKNIKKLFFKLDNNFEYNSRWSNIKHNFVNRILKKNVEINPDAFSRMWEIDDFLWRCTHAGKSSLVKWFLETTKSLKPEMIQEIFATQTFDALSPEVSKNIWRLLGKKMYRFSLLDDFKAFQGFFARNFSKYPSETFISNALSNRWKLKKLNDVEQTKYIETAKLNVSRYEKIANKVKTWVNNMIKDLGKFLDNPKMKPFYNGIKTKISNLTEYVKNVTPDGIKAMKEMSRLDKITWFGNLTPEWIAQLAKLNWLIKTNPALLKALQWAKEVEGIDGVKDILTKAGVDATKIDDNILLKLAQTKNAGKIKSIINYGSEIGIIKWFRKIIANPWMKAFGRRLWVVGVVVDLAFTGIEFWSTLNEAKEIKKYNIERWENKESKAYFDVITWWLAAGAVGCAFIPWVWRVASWVLLLTAGAITWIKEIGNAYYGEIDKFRQNYQDFLQKDLPSIKQNLIHVNNRQSGLNSSFQDFWSKITWNLAEEEKTKISIKNSADAIKALIYFEELQKYPYAMADLNKDEIRNDANLKALVEQQKDMHSKSVEERFSYIKKNYIDGKTNIINKDRLEKNEWVTALDEILDESRIYQTTQSDEKYTDKANIKWYKKYLENNLKWSNTEAFNKLENLYKTNQLYFYEIVASLPYYERMLNEYKVWDTDYQKISQNLEFLKQYISYKTLWQSVSEFPTINFDPERIDYNEINNLLLTFGVTATWFTSQEVTNGSIEYLDDNQINEKYNVSTSLGQNILYEIAKDSTIWWWYMWKNNLADLKIYFAEWKKESNWIYFNGKHRCINQNWALDIKFAKDNELNDINVINKMLSRINLTLHKPIWAWKMIVENRNLNDEYAQEYLNIINKEIGYRTNAMRHKLEILSYIKTNSNGKYIELDPDNIIKWCKAWIKNIWAFVYSRDGKKFDAKTNKTWLICELIK